MDILVALRQEEAKWKKQASAAQQQLDTVRAAIKLLGGLSSSGKPIGKKRKKNVMSTATKAKIAKAARERWAKIRTAKAKGKH